MDRRITIVGVGALGSHLVMLGRNWPARLTVIDHDRVERKNLLSQFHSKMGVGKSKAVALGQAMAGLFGVRVEAVPHRLTADNASALLDGADVVVDCVDNAPTRRLVRDVAQGRGTPCLHGALAADGGYARVMWADAFTVDEGGEGEATCEDGRHLPFVALVAARMATALQVFLEEGRQVGYHIHPGGVLPLDA